MQTNDLFFLKGGQGCRTHTYHPELQSDEVRVNANCITDKELNIHKDIGKVSGPVSLPLRLMHLQNGIQLEYNTMKRMRDNVDDNMITVDPESITTTNKAHLTACDKLMLELKTNPDVKFVVLYDDYCHIENITINSKKFDYDSSKENDTPISIEKDTTIYHDIIALRRGLMDSRNQKMMLAVAWTTRYESRKFQMYPEVVSMDVSEGTNAEKRPFFNAVNYEQGTTNVNTRVFNPISEHGFLIG